MIIFTVRCARKHEFDAWFRDSEVFEAQRQAREIVCPHCGDTEIEKALMAPHVGRSRAGLHDISPAQMRAALVEMRQQVEANCDYVGPRFAEEARRIHYGETDVHGIYGEATPEDARDLADEGIKFGRIPWIGPTDA